MTLCIIVSKAFSPLAATSSAAECFEMFLLVALFLVIAQSDIVSFCQTVRPQTGVKIGLPLGVVEEAVPAG